MQPGVQCLGARDVLAGEVAALFDVPRDRLFDLIGMARNDVTDGLGKDPRAQNVKDRVRVVEVWAGCFDCGTQVPEHAGNGSQALPYGEVDRDSSAEVGGPGDPQACELERQWFSEPSAVWERELGTRRSGPARADIPSATSATVRPVGPCALSVDQPSGVG